MQLRLSAVSMHSVKDNRCPVGLGARHEPVPLLFKTSDDDSWAHNGGVVSAEAISDLDSLGVLVSGK